MSSPVTAERFRDAALAEVRRYGSDPWVAVRELLQNARDAGATTVSLRTGAEPGGARLVCRDDGHGLSFEEAQRDLFTLYASRKHGRDAGRFGVGFWSVLLLEPSRLVVRSWPRRGQPWEVAWDGALAEGRRSPAPPGPTGTEIALTLPPRDGLSESVFAAAWRHARFLRRRDGRAPLAVRVDGRDVTAPFDLPAPSMAFRRRGLRGVVALAAEPSVELFAKGLLVRTAATIEDLVAPGARRGSRPPSTALAGLAPRFLLDSDDLDLLLSRGDARSDAALERVLAAARDELGRLLDRQLARSGPRPSRLTRPRAAVLATAVAAGAGVGAMVVPDAFTRPQRRLETPAAPAIQPLPDATGAAPAPRPLPYRDPRGGYAGPILDPLDHAPREVALRYEPAHLALHLAVLRIDAFDADGRPRVAREPVGTYAGRPCRDGCVSFTLQAAGPSWTALPLPTGHGLEPASLTLDGRPAQAWAAESGEPLVRLGDRPVAIRYRTGPEAEPQGRAPRPPALPDVLEPGVRALAGLPRFERPAAASRWVRSLVRDSRDGAVARRFAADARHGQDFARTAIALGAGDCDVQNGMVVRLLQAGGVPARLAVGHLGVDGRAVPGLHAWVEHRADGARWRVEDASRLDPGLEPTEAPAPVPVEPRVAAVRPALWPIGGALALAAGLALGAAVARKRGRRSFRLAPTLDVAALLRGALRSPEAAAGIPGLFERALIPRWTGGRTTLAEAEDASARRALYVAGRESTLARRAHGEGGLVLDAARPEARTIGDAFVAVDLDLWDRWLAAAEEPVEANRHLERAGARWRIRVGPDVGAPRVLDLPRSRVVLLDARAVAPLAGPLALVRDAGALLGVAEWEGGRRPVRLADAETAR